jgi:hypothetical protein
MGRTEESLAEMNRARSLDPPSLSMNFSLGWRLYMARQYDQAISQLLNTIEISLRGIGRRRNAIMVALFLSLLAIPAWAFGGSVLMLVVGSYVMQTGVLGVIYASIGQFENIHSKNFSLWPFQPDSAKHPVNAGSSWVPNPLRVAGVRRRSRWGMRRLVASTASS